MQISRFDDLRDELKLEGDEHAAVIDGEDFWLDENGRPNISDLMRRRGCSVLVAFDLL